MWGLDCPPLLQESLQQMAYDKSPSVPRDLTEADPWRGMGHPRGEG